MESGPNLILTQNIEFVYDDNIYLDALYSECNRIIKDKKGSQEFNLDEKIILSIGIRLKFEEKYYHLIESDDVSTNQTRMIYNKLGKDEKDRYSSIMIVTPDFIHINSFSYEPLVDIKIDRLISLYKDLDTA